MWSEAAEGEGLPAVPSRSASLGLQVRAVLIQEVSRSVPEVDEARVSSSLSNFLINVTGRGVMPRLRSDRFGSVIEGPIRHTITPEVPRARKNPGKGGRRAQVGGGEQKKIVGNY